MPPYHPQLAILVKSAPSGPGWLHELKYDGYRIGCRIERGRVTLLSRRGHDWTERFPTIATAAAALKVNSALFDGEVCSVLDDGRTSFQALQNATGRLVYFVFDLLYLDGRPFVSDALDARKRALKTVARVRGIEYADHIDGDGPAAFREACRLGLEGIVSKRRDQPYLLGARQGWLKTKCVRRQEFVIGGYTDPGGSRQGIGALLVGYYSPSPRGRTRDAEAALVFAGKVGTGFTAKAARDLRAALERLEVKTCPFTPTPPGWLGRHAHWVAPRLVGEVEFTEWTDEGKIRHPSFQGLRTDKQPKDVRRERER